MSQPFAIAVIGATGTVGETIVQILEERDVALSELHLLASAESSGTSLPFKGKNLRAREVDTFDFSKVGLAFFAAGAAVSLSFVPRALEAGCSVVDLSGVFDHQQASLMVPEINAAQLAGRTAPMLLSSPGSAATAVALALAPLRDLLDIQRVDVTACMAVSSLGREGVNELARQTAELLNMRPVEPRFYDRQVAFNVLAQLDTPDELGHAAHEKRLVSELRELLALPLLKICASCIQVPVFFGDSFSVSLQSAKDVDLAKVNQLLDAAPGVELVDAGDYPTPVGDAVGQDVVYVGRVRGGFDDPRQLSLWLTCDNVRKGAALNAVQLGELLIKGHV